MIKFSATLATLIAASVQAATVNLRILWKPPICTVTSDGLQFYEDAPTRSAPGTYRKPDQHHRGEVKNSVLVDKNGELNSG